MYYVYVYMWCIYKCDEYIYIYIDMLICGENEIYIYIYIHMCIYTCAGYLLSTYLYTYAVP